MLVGHVFSANQLVIVGEVLGIELGALRRKEDFKILIISRIGGRVNLDSHFEVGLEGVGILIVVLHLVLPDVDVAPRINREHFFLVVDEVQMDYSESVLVVELSVDGDFGLVGGLRLSNPPRSTLD